MDFVIRGTIHKRVTKSKDRYLVVLQVLPVFCRDKREIAADLSASVTGHGPYKTFGERNILMWYVLRTTAGSEKTWDVNAHVDHSPFILRIVSSRKKRSFTVKEAWSSEGCSFPLIYLLRRIKPLAGWRFDWWTWNRMRAAAADTLWQMLKADISWKVCAAI